MRRPAPTASPLNSTRGRVSTDTPGDQPRSDASHAETTGIRNPATSIPTPEEVSAPSAADEALRTTESRLRRAVASGHVGLWEWNLLANTVYYSTEWKRQIGYEAHEISDSFDEWRDRLHPDDRERSVTSVNDYVRSPVGLLQLEFRFRHKDGSYRWILSQASVERDGSGGAAFLLGAHLDITERKQAEEDLRQRSALQGLSADILATLNQPLSLGEATRRILNAIKRVTGVDAAGIRLRQGFDFPYAAADGFSADFLDSENSLLPRGPDRGFCTEADGSPRLACSCGMVVGGKARELGLPMSDGGSVWANDALSFLDVAPADDPRLSPRNLCIHEGYQSVALVPIRLRGDIVGLLQLNDRRPNRFTPDTIRFFDGIAASFAVALSRRRDEEALQASESNLRSLFDAIPESVTLMDGDGTLLAANETFARRFGKTAAECVGRDAFELVSGEVSERRKKVFADVMRSGKPAVFEDQRDDRWLQLHLCPVAGPDGTARRLVVFGVDITERRRMEEEIHVERELLRLAIRAGQAAASDWDIEHDRVFWTAEMFPLWGIEPVPNPVPAHLWQSRIHPDDRDHVAAALQEALRTGTLPRTCASCGRTAASGGSARGRRSTTIRQGARFAWWGSPRTSRTVEGWRRHLPRRTNGTGTCSKPASTGSGRSTPRDATPSPAITSGISWGWIRRTSSATRRST
jgi:PAS domain S-box-containing protein